MVNQLHPDRSGIAIRLVRTWKPDEIADLYRVGGWWREDWDASELPRLIRGSYAFAVAIDEKSGRAVGMGRIISDGVSDAYIQDVVVDPVFRHQGIGCMLVAELLTHCLSAGIAWIGCIATPQTAGFYRELGFVTMNDYTPMLYGGGGGDLPL
jgi:ribosomal protein S18 acetylase RimI-like enzyme